MKSVATMKPGMAKGAASNPYTEARLPPHGGVLYTQPNRTILHGDIAMENCSMKAVPSDRRLPAKTAVSVKNASAGILNLR